MRRPKTNMLILFPLPLVHKGNILRFSGWVAGIAFVFLSVLDR